jgi:hypothetical protein
LHAHGLGSLLGEGRGIEDQHGIGLAQVDGDLACQFVQQGAVVPGRLADELLQCLAFLVVQVGDGLGVFIGQVGEQSLEVVMGVAALLVALQGGDEGLEEVLQSWEQAAQQAGVDLGIIQKFLQADPKTSLHRPPPFSGK